MKHRYRPRDYGHIARMLLRHRRQQTWGRHFEQAVRDESFQLPAASVVTIIPTEKCNLRCPMCNQWGEQGYFLNGARPARHMDEGDLVKLMRDLSPEASLLNIHGGEPLVYKHTDTLLELLIEKPFDVILATNGTQVRRYAAALAKIRNLAIIFSIDGDEATHDSIRGDGVYQKAREGFDALCEERRRLGLPLPLLLMSFVVCEWNSDKIETVFEIARAWGVFLLNYNLRYFMPEQAGLAYEKHLQEHFGLTSSGAWRGWISASHARHDYQQAGQTLQRVMRKHRFRLRPPYVYALPRQVRGRDFEAYFTDYLNVFDNETCFMPFYWARAHSNGDMIYCPGHPGIVVGNVFREGFMAAFNSEMSVRFRRHILTNRLPICNRCCGLFMSYSARPREHKARRRRGLGEHVAVHY